MIHLDFYTFMAIGGFIVAITMGGIYFARGQNRDEAINNLHDSLPDGYELGDHKGCIGDD